MKNQYSLQPDMLFGWVPNMNKLENKNVKKEEKEKEKEMSKE
jgi:hypothetical protein